jgi:hydrogenase maturation protease
VAGIGNIFLGDDGFGVEVVRRMAQQPLPEHVEIVDAGIRGMHLAYQIAEQQYDAVILVDAVPRGNPPGTLYAIEPELTSPSAEAPADAHTMTPHLLLAWIGRMGVAPSQIRIVGCEPATLEASIGLSDAIEGRIDAAIDLVRDVIANIEGQLRTPSCA